MSTPGVLGATNNLRNGHTRWKSRVAGLGWGLEALLPLRPPNWGKLLWKEVLYPTLSLGGVGPLSGPPSVSIKSPGLPLCRTGLVSLWSWGGSPGLEPWHLPSPIRNSRLGLCWDFLWAPAGGWAVTEAAARPCV